MRCTPTVADAPLSCTRTMPEQSYPQPISQPAPSSMALIAVDRIFAFLQTCMKWGAGAYIAATFAHELRLSIGLLAGQETYADLTFSYFLNSPSGLTVSVSIGFSLMCLGYGLGERALRHRTLARYQNRNADLERSIDSNRTSSGLTAAGRTHPRDK